MSQFVLVLGVFTILLSLLLGLQPRRFLTLADQVLNTRWLFAAALLRFLVGALLIAAAPAVQHSEIVALLGWLFALAGLLLVTLPPAVIDWMADRVTRFSPAQMRLWLSVSAALGCWLVYVALPTAI